MCFLCVCEVKNDLKLGELDEFGKENLKDSSGVPLSFVAFPVCVFCLKN